MAQLFPTCWACAGKGVTEGAIKPKEAGLIGYARGHITVLDRPGLEKRSCDCYTVVKEEYDRRNGARVLPAPAQCATLPYCLSKTNVSSYVLPSA